MHTDFNTEGKDAKFGVKFKLRNGNIVSFWYETKSKQEKELKKWKKQVGRDGDAYVSVVPTSR